MIGDSDDETNFLHKSLWTDGQVSKLRKTFPSNSFGNTKLSETQLSKMAQLGEFMPLTPPKMARSLEKLLEIKIILNWANTFQFLYRVRV